MMVGRHLPSFAAAIPSRGSTATMEAPEAAGPEVTVTDKPIAIQRAWRNNNGNGTTRPIMLAIAGDSASGKTTITKGIVEALGPERITSICVDDYHRFDREERKDKPFTPLHPDCNYIEIMEQHLQLLAMGHPILKPVYNHKDGTLGRPKLVEPREFVIIEGLHPLHTRLARACFDATVYLDPPEEIRFQWKLNRDTGKRGYREEQVRKEMEKREPESAEFIRPQRSNADIVIRFAPIEGRQSSEDEPLSATILLRPTISHPELSKILTDDHREAMHLKLSRDEDGKPVDSLHIHSYADREITREVEEEIWKELGVDEEVPPALGTIDKGVRSEPLAQAQLILLYHLFQARNG
ncbi:MAG: phosphoribulokinase [Acidimicrobiaceae bacterium]|jgi:phosphoribulokinase